MHFETPNNRTELCELPTACLTHIAENAALVLTRDFLWEDAFAAGIRYLCACVCVRVCVKRQKAKEANTKWDKEKRNEEKDTFLVPYWEYLALHRAI